jgi:GNAT superfamily N-acetyltransferase
MNDQDLVERSARAWRTAIARMTAALPEGLLEEAPHGTLLVFTGAPVPWLNGVMCVAAEPDPDEIATLAAAAAKWPQAQWSIQVRAEPGEEIARIAADHSLADHSEHPFMVKPLGPEPDSDSTDPTDALETVRPIDPEEHETYAAALAAGFEAPLESLAQVASPAVIAAPGVTAYIAEYDGTAVATALGMMVDDCVAVFNISTHPLHRKKGLGQAVTEAVLRDGRAAGATVAFLHATEAGQPLYERMGFRVVERWTHFATAFPAE